MAEIEQFIFIQGFWHEGAFQQARQIVVIIRQANELAERKEVMNDQAFVQLQAISTRHTDIAAAQFANQRPKHQIAPLQENENITGLDSAILRHPFALANPFANTISNNAGKDAARVILGRQIHRGFPIIRLFLLGFFDQRPQFKSTNL